jgi:hypothetical protein
MKRAMVLLLLAGAMASPAHAEEAPICTDRPTKANAVCTVPAGKWQLESSAANWLRIEQGGSGTETLLLGASVVKLGVSEQSDLQLAFTPYVRISTDGNHVSGFGDATLRYKHRMTGADSAVQAALIPFVKLPTAKTGIGNGKAEGGVALPFSFALAGPVAATLGPEADLLADGDGHGRHLALVNLINLSASIAPRITFAAELWSNFNFDPAGTIRQASADAAVAYSVNRRFQLDAGANLGLTRDTPDIEIYAGASFRF